MKRKLASLLISMTLLLSMTTLALNVKTVRSDPGTIIVPDNYPTIQTAINAANPGDTILVHAGTYNESVVINKPLQVIGDGADVTTIDGNGLTLASAGLVKITADSGDVRFSGFTVKNAPGVGADNVRIAILTRSDLAGPTCTITDNMIYGTNNPDEAYDFGFYVSYGKENIVFEQNLITETGSNNIVVEQASGAIEISHNTLDAGCWGIDAIFFMVYDGLIVTALQNVSYNTFDMGTGVQFDYGATGVSFCSPAPDIGNLPSGKYSNMLISGNIFNNLKNNRRAIGFWNAGPDYNLIAPTITGNTVNGIPGSTGSFGIDFYGNTTDATITGNTISGVDKAITLRYGRAINTEINSNNIAGNNIGLDWALGPDTVDARFNWWGDPTGPYNPELNPSGLGDSVGAQVSFEPWLIAPYPPETPVETLLCVNPSSIEYWTVSSGKNFTVGIALDDVTNLLGFDFKLYWDTGLLRLVHVQLTLPWSTYITAKNETREDLGRYWLAASAYNVPPYTGSTTLVRLTFMITYDPIYPANRTCKLDLADSDLSAPSGQPIYHMEQDGDYTIYSTRPQIKVDPATYNAHALGKIFKVNVTISDVVHLYNCTFKLSYDTTMLDAISLEVGPFLNRPIYTYQSLIDDYHGLVYLWVWSTGGALPTDGSGVLATITFKVTKATLWRSDNPNVLTCAFDLHDTMLITNTGVQVTHGVSDGTYNYVPKPGDLDYDGHVGLSDLRIVTFYYAPAYSPVADVNEDGKVNIFDLTLVATYYGVDC